MSVEDKVAEVLSDTTGLTATRARVNLGLAKQEVAKMLSVSNSSIFDLCMNIENAWSKATVKSAFKQFNGVIRIFMEAAPGAEHSTETIPGQHQFLLKK